MQRIAGIACGVAVQAFFLATVWRLYWFLSGQNESLWTAPVWTDVPLALQFSVVHSLLLLPGVRKRLETWIAPSFYGLFYCLATCGGLWLIFLGWQRSPDVLIAFSTPLQGTIQAAFFLSWGALFYSLHLTGLGYQTGLTPWWYWVRRQPSPRRRFDPRSLYRWLRHPVYLSFLGLVWFHPEPTLDRLLLIAVWTPYIFVGSYLKDQRLLFYLRETYRDYQARVPGYPGMFVGPLARIPHRKSEPAIPAIVPLAGPQRAAA
ncbi:MAG TPA: NnrU family protein [Planctomycetaceae bacterium]|nr:NnrU family protein [Planctomycetaceae bacterium]